MNIITKYKRVYFANPVKSVTDKSKYLTMRMQRSSKFQYRPIAVVLIDLYHFLQLTNMTSQIKVVLPGFKGYGKILDS